MSIIICEPEEKQYKNQLGLVHTSAHSLVSLKLLKRR